MGSERNDGSKPQQSGLFQPNIGLDSEVRRCVVDLLNRALANEAILSQKMRGARWNASGPGFFEQQSLCAAQYQELNGITDEIAERVRVLGGRAISSYQEFLRTARLEEQPNPDVDLLHLLADQEACIRFLREDARRCSEEYEDDGTFDLLAGILRRHETMAWMLRGSIEGEALRGNAQIKVQPRS